MRLHGTGVLNIQYNELNNIISDSEVGVAIKQLKRGKAAGCDHLINEVYIHVYGCDQLLRKLSALFNVVFKCSHFPKLWQEGIIVPIHKKGSVENVQNYRGITLLNTLGKLFTRIINNWLNYWSDTYHIINDNQSGFWRGMSTADNIYILQSVIDVAFNRDNKVFCASIDFSKAFDYINRDCLLYKLLKSGIRGNIFNIIKLEVDHSISVVLPLFCCNQCCFARGICL